jgi:hypothetical protein
MSAPTEAEIRASIEAAWQQFPNDDPRRRLAEVVPAFADPIRWQLGDSDLLEEEQEFGQLGDAIWKDLRPTEAVRLLKLLYAAEQRALAGAIDLIVGEYVAAALAFAGEFPDIPRGPVGEAPRV